MTDQAVDAAELFETHLPYALAIATCFPRPDFVTLDEVEQDARMGLWEATRRFDSDGIPRDEVERVFRVFARLRIRGAIIDGLRARHGSRSMVTIDAFAQDQRGLRGELIPTPPELRCEPEDTDVWIRELLAGLVEDLPERQRFVAGKYYYHGWRFAEIATELGVSACRVAQIHKDLLGRMRQATARTQLAGALEAARAT